MNIVTSELTGLPVDTSSQEWLLECEARTVLDMPTREKRNQFMQLVEKKRGAEQAQKLRVRVMDLYTLRKRRADLLGAA